MIVRRAFTLVVLVAVLACREYGPTAEDARAEFSQRFPDLPITSIEVNEDEVAARTFEIVVEHDGRAHSIYFLYLHGDSRWSLPQDSREVLRQIAK